MAAWQNDYLQGTGCEMYTETLSHSFAGMTFAQAAEWEQNLYHGARLTSAIHCSRLCFVKLKLLLLSIEAKQGEGGDTKISINPRQNKITANMVGFFMAQSAEEVKRSVNDKKYCFNFVNGLN